MQGQRTSGSDDIGDGVGHTELNRDLDGAIEADHRGLDSPCRQIFSDQIGIRGCDALAGEISVQLGVADAIADVVGSGRTLTLHDLAAFGESLCDSEAVLIERDGAGDDASRAARDQLAARVQGVVFGQQYLMLDYDCPRAVLESATAITPGLESPTIAPLADPDWVAVRALVPRREVNAIMDRIAAIGAKAILASDVRFFRF
jgi:ATP phosphoribosyltransferase